MTHARGLLGIGLIVLMMAACMGPLDKPVSPNPFGGETEDMVWKPGDKDFEEGFDRTIYYYDGKGTKRRQVDFFSDRHVMYKRHGAARAVADFDKKGTLLEIKLYGRDGDFLESILPQPQ